MSVVNIYNDYVKSRRAREYGAVVRKLRPSGVIVSAIFYCIGFLFEREVVRPDGRVFTYKQLFGRTYDLADQGYISFGAREANWR